MISANRVEKIIYSYPFFNSDPVLKLLPDNKVEVSGICAWCNGNGSVDFHSCYTCSGSGWLVFEDEEEVREEQTDIEIKVE
jgi:hypothetical protein